MGDKERRVVGMVWGRVEESLIVGRGMWYVGIELGYVIMNGGFGWGEK